MREKPPEEEIVGVGNETSIHEVDTPTTPEETGAETTAGDSGNMSGSFMNSENRDALRSFGDKTRDVLSSAYKGLYEIPVVNRVVGKMEIAYDQFWADRNEKKSIELKTEADGFDAGIKALDESRKEIKSVIEDLQNQGLSGVESLQLKLRELDDKEAVLSSKKDKIQSKFEERQNKVSLYTNERDKITDRIVSYYEGKIEPLERELNELETDRNQVSLDTSVMEMRHKELNKRIDKIEDSKKRTERSLGMSGMSKKDIDNFDAVKMIDNEIKNRRRQMMEGREAIKERSFEINRKITEIDAEANPYRDKREEFGRIKERRPLGVGLEKRKKKEVLENEEEVAIGTRDTESVDSFEATEETPEEQVVHETDEVLEEEVENGEEHLSIESHLSEWNKYLKEEHGKRFTAVIDSRDFIRLTRLRLNEQLDFSELRNILEKYYKLKKISLPFNRDADKFTDKMLKENNS